jgi:hypothetical protein
MAEYDSNMIKPVEGLPNIKGLAPAKRREERKRRQQLREQDRPKDESDENGAGQPEEWTENGNGRQNGGIDYCA